MYSGVSRSGYRCPLCMRSALDMTRYWRQLDDEVAQTPMPLEYQNMTVDVSRKKASNLPGFLVVCFCPFAQMCFKNTRFQHDE